MSDNRYCATCVPGVEVVHTCPTYKHCLIDHARPVLGLNRAQRLEPCRHCNKPRCWHDGNRGARADLYNPCAAYHTDAESARGWALK